MPRALIYTTVGALLLAGAAALFAPASLLDGPLAARTDGRLRLVDTRGLWWKGRGVVAAATGSARLPVAWRLDAIALAQGHVRIVVGDGDNGSPRGTVVVHRDGLGIDRLHARVPASFASALAPPLRALSPGGMLVVDAQHLDVMPQRTTGALDAQWIGASIATGPLTASLGTVSFALSSIADGVSGTVRNDGGDVSIDGVITGSGRRVEAALTLKANPGASDGLRALLPLLGPTDNAGNVRVAWSGRR
ncbi:MAG: type II secretion system protein N [Betaproteobacteria bacterium]